MQLTTCTIIIKPIPFSPNQLWSKFCVSGTKDCESQLAASLNCKKQSTGQLSSFSILPLLVHIVFLAYYIKKSWLFTRQWKLIYIFIKNWFFKLSWHKALQNTFTYTCILLTLLFLGEEKLVSAEYVWLVEDPKKTQHSL